MKLLIAKTLSKLDKFLGNEKYIDIYYKYQPIFFSQTNDVSNKVMDAIKRNDYETVAIHMKVLQSSSSIEEHFFDQAKRALNIALESLIEDVKIQVTILRNITDIDKITCIVDNLEQIQRAKQFISQHLDTPDAIDPFIAEVKQDLKSRIIRYLRDVERLITIDNFHEADRHIYWITHICTLLRSYCIEDVFESIEALKEQHHNVVLKDVVDKYSEMDISGYTLNPPTDIFEKFELVDNTNPVYKQASNTIKERILAKFRKELDKAKSTQVLSRENIYIRRFETAIKYLPNAMRNALEVELKYCKDNVDTAIQDNENNLNMTINRKDPKNIRILLEEYRASKYMQSYVYKAKELVSKQITEMVLKIKQNLEQSNMRDALDGVKKLYEYQIVLGNLVQGIRNPYFQIQKLIQNRFEELHSRCTNLFSYMNLSIVTEDIVEGTAKNFICIIEFVEFVYEHKDQHILAGILPIYFDEKIITLKNNILQYFSEHQHKYEDALEKLNITSLKNALDITRQWNSLFMKIKGYDNTQTSNDPSMNTIVKASTKLTSYPQILEAISHKMQELKNELNNLELINSETKELTKHRNEFYRKLNEKFLFLTEAEMFDTDGLSIDIKKIERECIKSLEKKINEIASFAENFMEKFSADVQLTGQDYDNFNQYYNNLISFKKEMKEKNFEVHIKIERIEKMLFDKIQMWQSVNENRVKVETIATNLINMKRAS
ncbi:unnamed protein product, partial [Rotaria sp. Silwood2]